MFFMLTTLSHGAESLLGSMQLLSLSQNTTFLIEPDDAFQSSYKPATRSYPEETNKQTQSRFSQPTFFGTILALFLHVSSNFLTGFPAKSMQAFIIPVMRAICLNYLILLDVNWSTFCNFVNFPSFCTWPYSC
jgi:hypothetical protein